MSLRLFYPLENGKTHEIRVPEQGSARQDSKAKILWQSAEKCGDNPMNMLYL
jgi:hypothetical protein